MSLPFFSEVNKSQGVVFVNKNTPMKRLLLFLVFALPIVVMAQTKTFYDFTVLTIDGEKISLSTFKGKKVLVVNVASKCGFTPQYEGLEALYRKYKGQNFVVIGFPANNFLGQEPGTNEEIKQFCTLKYDVTFPMMAKISVKGKDIHPLYKWLTNKSENGVLNAKVKWNFQKFMIDETGKLVGFASPSEKPNSEKIVKWIESK
jgi:glutathione peroxidase